MSKQKPLSIRVLPVGQMNTNCYLVWDDQTHEGLIVDPGDDAEYIADQIKKEEIQPKVIIATHGHFDHIMGGFVLQNIFLIPLILHKNDEFLRINMQKSAKYFLGINCIDPPPVVHHVCESETAFQLGNREWILKITPGHTPGSMMLLCEKERVIFVGDTVFAGGAVGRTDFSYSSSHDLLKSIQKILAYPEEYRLLPGHGEETMIYNERAYHTL